MSPNEQEHLSTTVPIVEVTNPQVNRASAAGGWASLREAVANISMPESQTFHSDFRPRCILTK